MILSQILKSRATKPEINNSINLNKLKKGIDVRIQAILAYLQNQDNFKNTGKIEDHKPVLSNQTISSTNANQLILDINSKIENASTTINARQSYDYQITHDPQHSTMLNRQNRKQGRASLMHDELQRMVQNQYKQKEQERPYRARASQPIQSSTTYGLKQKQIQAPQFDQIPQKQGSKQYSQQLDWQKLMNSNNSYENGNQQIISSTPFKFSSKIIQMEDQLSQDSDQSLSKRNIQEKVDSQIFGVPLSTSINANNIVIMEALDLNANNYIKQVKVHSNKKASKVNKQKKVKQNFKTQSPHQQVSASKKPRVEKKTPYKTPHKTPFSNTCSGAKKLFQLFSGVERATKPITQQGINKMKQQIEAIVKKCRRQAQDSNVRTKLLKRIEGCRSKGASDFLLLK